MTIFIIIIIIFILFESSSLLSLSFSVDSIVIMIITIIISTAIISTVDIATVICHIHIHSCTLLQQLGEVARDSIGDSAPPPMEDLLACVKNIRQVALLLQQPGRRFKGPAGLQAAAVCIQAHWR